MNVSLRFIFLAFSISILSIIYGCGGGSSTSTTPTVEIVEGLWAGAYVSTSGQQPSLAVALVTSDGKVGISVENGLVFVGLNELVGNESGFLGSENISPSSPVSMGVTKSAESQFEAQVQQGALSLQVGDVFAMVYSDAYERPSSFTRLEGSWAGTNTIMLGGSGVAMNWALTFMNDGTFTGTADTLTVNGTVSIIDDTKNAYAFSMTVTSSGGNNVYEGTYSGTASLVDDLAENDTLLMFLQREGANPILGRLMLK